MCSAQQLAAVPERQIASTDHTDSKETASHHEDVEGVLILHARGYVRKAALAAAALMVLHCCVHLFLLEFVVCYLHQCYD